MGDCARLPLYLDDTEFVHVAGRDSDASKRACTCWEAEFENVISDTYGREDLSHGGS